MPSRMLAGECIIKAVHQHRIEELPVAHTVAPTPGTHEIRRKVHIFHAAGNRAINEPEHHFLRRAGDRLRTRATDAIDCHRRNIDRHSAMDGRLPGRVHLVASLNHIAHDDCVDLTRR